MAKKMMVELTRSVVERAIVWVELPDDIKPEDVPCVLHGLYEERAEELAGRWKPDNDAEPVEGAHHVHEDTPYTTEETEYTYTDAEGWAG